MDFTNVKDEDEVEEKDLMSDFIFIPNLDILGHDMYRHKKPLQELLQIAHNDKLCVGFNTLGFFKNKIDTENQLPLSLFIYPVLFLTTGLAKSKVLTYIYVILFTSLASLWGFFGIEWFVKKKKEFEDTINNDMCKAYLGISDGDLSLKPKETSQTEINKRNIQYIYIAVSLIFIIFVLAMLFTYVSMNSLM